MNIGQSLFISQSKKQGSWLFFIEHRKLRGEKNVPCKDSTIAPQMTRSALYHKTIKARVPRDFYTITQTCNLVLIIEPESQHPMPQNICLLEPRTQSPYELGLPCLFLLCLSLSKILTFNMIIRLTSQNICIDLCPLGRLFNKFTLVKRLRVYHTPTVNGLCHEILKFRVLYESAIPQHWLLDIRQ